jgi:hypothetical protein
MAAGGGGGFVAGAAVHWQERLKCARLVGAGLAALCHGPHAETHGSSGGRSDPKAQVARHCLHELLGDLHQKVKKKEVAFRLHLFF